MSHVDSPAETAQHFISHSITGTRLHGHRLVFARIAWVVLVVFSIAIFFINLPRYFAHYQTICTVAACASDQLTFESVQALQSFGLSITGYALAIIAITLISTVMCLAIALFIVWYRSTDWMALLVALTLVLMGTTYVTYILLEHPSPAQLPALILNTLGFGVFFLVFAVFPTGRFVPPWMVWLPFLWMVWGVIFTVLFVWHPIPFLLHELVWLGGAFCIFFTQIYRYWRVSTPHERQQTKWVVFGVSLSLAVSIALRLLTFLLMPPGHTNFLYTLISTLGYNLAIQLGSLSIGLAVLRSHLWDIDVIINRTLVYGTLTVMLALVYFNLVLGLQLFIQLVTGTIAEQPLVIVVSTLAIATLFQPMRRRIQKIIDRRFYRHKYDAAEILNTFSATLRTEVDLNRLRKQLILVVEETMQPTFVSLWLRQPVQDEERKP